MQANIQYMKPARELKHAGIFRLPADMTLPELAIILPSERLDLNRPAGVGHCRNHS